MTAALNELLITKFTIPGRVKDHLWCHGPTDTESIFCNYLLSHLIQSSTDDEEYNYY